MLSSPLYSKACGLDWKIGQLQRSVTAPYGAIEARCCVEMIHIKGDLITMFMHLCTQRKWFANANMVSPAGPMLEDGVKR